MFAPDQIHDAVLRTLQETNLGDARTALVLVATRSPVANETEVKAVFAHKASDMTWQVGTIVTIPDQGRIGAGIELKATWP